MPPAVSTSTASSNPIRVRRRRFFMRLTTVLVGQVYNLSVSQRTGYKPVPQDTILSDHGQAHGLRQPAGVQQDQQGAVEFADAQDQLLLEQGLGVLGDLLRRAALL